ncbi:penicillin-binding protein activator [Azospirillum sp. SYSU D00513]|uniref:penicillin-binding protein activator n=1 Tax=Azospirillum sp. SYSU D00513 TaxID=2812561 RepID=UPI0032B47634
MARLATPFSRGREGHRALSLLFVGLLAACGRTVTVPAPVSQAPQPVQEAQRPTKVALLLPLSGPRASVGEPMLQAAQLALFDLAGSNFELLPRDTKGTPAGAANAARQAAAEGATLILGPLFREEVAAVKPVAQGAGVGVLAFTNDATLAGNGTYVLGLTPANHVERVVGYARAQGITRYTALVPRSPYGEQVVRVLQGTAQRLGGQAQVERYDPAIADPAQPAQQLAGAAPRPQAVLLAEVSPRVQPLAAALAGAGVDPAQVRFLGAGLWDEPALAQEPALNGAWFAAPSPQTRADFEARFESLYSARPPRVATLAYDATAIAAVLSQNGGPRPFEARALQGPGGFEGVDGLFRLTPGGLAERSLAVMEVTPTGPRVLDPAPNSFDVLGQ